MDSQQLEKYSSAITLSDMEIFVYPELMYSLVLANIMSPVIWKWREAACFKKLAGKSNYKKLMRLKQFIMDHYEFNLDLETWGLTNQKTELDRFASQISSEDIAKSNALFGYHGDKYYFDVDIRKHFGLDRYDSDIIPYWKTETVEAMDAFKHREGYKKGAGECVSLAGLYAAAAFVVCQIPLEDIYMILTPLHSQNFIDVNSGVLTNNRRIVTKSMWFNGTAISEKAQRALRNEQVTTVAHNTGYLHCLYKEATIKKSCYEHFVNQINKFVSEELSRLMIANFLRSHQDYQQYFQFCCDECKKGAKYAKAEVLFHYEHGSKFRIADETFEKLLDEAGEDDLSRDKISDRLCCKQFCAFMKYENLDIRKESDWPAIKKYIAPFVPGVDKFIAELSDFLHFAPRLSNTDKTFISSEAVEVSVDQSREEIIEYLKSIRSKNITADLAFYAYRDVESCDWRPFIKAAIERNPVSLEMTRSLSLEDTYLLLKSFRDDSIYQGKRLAVPDEVANYKRGDGLEKAFMMANVIKSREAQSDIELIIDREDILLKSGKEYAFSSIKDVKKHINLSANGNITFSD